MLKSIVVITLSYLCSTVIYASVCLSTNVIEEPPQFQWTHHPVTANNPEEYYSGIIEMAEEDLTFFNGDTLTTRVYRQANTVGTIPGPTMTMVPGNKYVLRFKNTLPFQTAAIAHNIFKDENISNIHTHGLHISGETPSDDVTRSFAGGEGGDFVYDIPADHMGGTYWYHAHHHGSTFLQISGGAFGLIIIDDGNDGIPATVANMVERQLVVAYVDPEADKVFLGDPNNLDPLKEDPLLTGTLAPTWTVNGTIAGNMCMPQNTWQHFRILVADRDAKPKNITINGPCQVELMARDGVWRTTVPLNLSSQNINLTGASRADLAVKCSADATIRVDGVVKASIQVDSSLPQDIDETSTSPFDGDGSTTWSATRPNYLPDLRGLTPDFTEIITITGNSIGPFGSDRAYQKDNENFSYSNDSLIEWTLNTGTAHPFHLHIYHVQVQDSNCGIYEAGEYYDVVTDNNAGGCKVRYSVGTSTSSAFAGRTIFHCHVLEHEDNGAMGWIDVLTGQSAPTFPIDNVTSVTYQNIFTSDGDDDDDGIDDIWEYANGLNPLDASDAALDPDNDGINNLQEYLNGTDPNDGSDCPSWICGSSKVWLWKFLIP